RLLRRRALPRAPGARRRPLREDPARLQLEQGGEEDEKLPARLEIELVALKQALEEGEHDPGDVELAQIQLVLQDEGQQEVERAFECVEIRSEERRVGKEWRNRWCRGQEHKRRHREKKGGRE